MFHYPQQQTFANNHPSTNIFMANPPFFYHSNGPVLNQSTHNLNFNPDFERFSTPHHGFASMPSGGYPFFDYTNQNFDQQRWRQNLARAQQQQQHRRTPAFHFQDKSTSYFMTEPIVTSDDRITIQLTKVHVGPNGDQQRVFVEQEFSNENELSKFVRNLRQNFEKTFNNRSTGGNSNKDESTSTNSKKSGVVVVEEPDEEPKIYQQQAYNANIESKKAAAASVLTPPMSPTMESAPPKFEKRSPPLPPNIEHHRKKQASPLASPMSSSSTPHSNRYHRNKMKYRRQQTDHREEMKSSRVFQMPGCSRPFQATPIPPRFQQRFFIPNPEFNMPQNPNFPWRFNQNGYPKNRSRSYVPPMNDHFPPPPPPPPPTTPSRFTNTADPFFRPINPTRFAQNRQKDSRPPPSPSKLRRSNRRKATQPATIAEHHFYPNHEQQQPRVHRTKSDSRNLPHHQQQQHRSRSTTNHFHNFSPLQQQQQQQQQKGHIQKHFVPFRSPPVILTSVHSTTPIFYPNQRRQFANMQPQLRLINHFHLGTNRF